MNTSWKFFIFILYVDLASSFLPFLKFYQLVSYLLVFQVKEKTLLKTATIKHTTQHYKPTRHHGLLEHCIQQQQNTYS